MNKDKYFTNKGLKRNNMKQFLLPILSILLVIIGTRFSEDILATITNNPLIKLAIVLVVGFILYKLRKLNNKK
jgi:hypothetical protein